MYLIIFTSIKKKQKKTECDIFKKKGKLKKVQDIWYSGYSSCKCKHSSKFWKHKPSGIYVSDKKNVKKITAKFHEIIGKQISYLCKSYCEKVFYHSTYIRKTFKTHFWRESMSSSLQLVLPSELHSWSGISYPNTRFLFSNL